MVMVVNTINANGLYIQLHMHSDPLPFLSHA